MYRRCYCIFSPICSSAYPPATTHTPLQPTTPACNQGYPLNNIAEATCNHNYLLYTNPFIIIIIFLSLMCVYIAIVANNHD